MKKLQIISRNFRMFGAKYVFWDVFYQIIRAINNITKKEVKKEKDIIKHKVNDYFMFINKNGKGIHRDLYLKSTREESSVKITKELLKKGDIVLEAGANIGYYVILESKKIGKEGKIYAVEPVKENFELLKKNVEINKLKNVEINKLAFSDSNGEIEINISSDSNLNTPIKIGNSSKTEKVKSITLDSFFKDKRKPTFMRMDIEGFENVIFMGGIETLKYLEKIFVELHFPLVKKEEMISLLELLKEKGFEIYKAVMEWERLEDESNFLGKCVNYLYKKRSKPIVYDSKDLTIDKLINSKEFIGGHLSLEVFFVKERLIDY